MQSAAIKHKLRSDLTMLPKAMRHLPIDERGYPVPALAAWVGGKLFYRPQLFACALHDRLCWVCGGVLGSFKTFIVDPLCLITGITGELPLDWDCASWCVCNRPFKSKPGVIAVAVFRGYKPFRDDVGRHLIRMPIEDDESVVHWYRLGRPATRAEVKHSVETGLPVLVGLARKQGVDAVFELENKTRQFQRWLPAE
jgi:hypothetical protein